MQKTLIVVKLPSTVNNNLKSVSVWNKRGEGGMVRGGNKARATRVEWLMSDVIISRVVAKHGVVIGKNNNEWENIVGFTF